jgi:hypothetical protein
MILSICIMSCPVKLTDVSVERTASMCMFSLLFNPEYDISTFFRNAENFARLRCVTSLKTELFKYFEVFRIPSPSALMKRTPVLTGRSMTQKVKLSAGIRPDHWTAKKNVCISNLGANLYCVTWIRFVDSKGFWRWCITQTKSENQVILSEYDLSFAYAIVQSILSHCDSYFPFAISDLFCFY